MIDRRRFVASSALSALSTSLAWAPVCAFSAADKPKRLAVVTTLWTYRSHAWHMAERFLGGMPDRGRWRKPNCQVVSAYVDQRPVGDLSERRAKESGFTVYPSVAEALRCGGDKLAVDGVLLIGEHGEYPVNEFGQKLYPRYELFQKIVQVYEAEGRAAPVFNDKHLSWSFEKAAEMVAQSKRLGFGFSAGSSLPYTWRMPSIEMPRDAKIEEAMVVATGPKDIYDFHALETLQCMVERRAGGETGVRAVQAIQGEAVWQAMATGSWKAGGWNPALFEACLSRSQTLTQPDSYSHRYPTLTQMREMVKNPIIYRIEYASGLVATMMMLDGLVEDFTFAAKLEGQDRPLSTLFYLPPKPNVAYSAALMEQADRTFQTNQAPSPIERTLLTSGMVEACLQSLTKDQQRLETPHLAVKYNAPEESQFWRD